MRELLTERGQLFIDIVDFRAAYLRDWSVEDATKIDHPYYLTQNTMEAYLRRAGFAIAHVDYAADHLHVSYLCRPGDAGPRRAAGSARPCATCSARSASCRTRPGRGDDGVPRGARLVPARGGSKGVPGKNVRPLAGRTLLDYVTAAAARASGVSTGWFCPPTPRTIAAAGRAAGLEVPFLRPAELAQDDTPMLPVVRHALDWLMGRGLGTRNSSSCCSRRRHCARPTHIDDAVRRLADVRSGFGRDGRRSAAAPARPTT